MSPYVVVYAESLLLAQYIYGLNLKESELPSSVNGVDLVQIGLGPRGEDETGNTNTNTNRRGKS
jgi:hypothetical protein